MAENSKTMLRRPPYIYLERTLAIIKPDATNKEQEIVDIILNSGFTIAQRRKTHLTPEQASDFYVDHFGKMFFPALVAYMSSAPIVVMLLVKKDALTAWQVLIGPANPIQAQETHPGCLRATYGTDQTRNALHGSETYKTAQREIKFFFHDNIYEPIPKEADVETYLNLKIYPILFKGLTAICKQKPPDPMIWLADWLRDHNPNAARLSVPTVTSSPPSATQQ